MKTHLYGFVAAMVCVCVLFGCRGGSGSAKAPKDSAGGPAGFLANPGKTPEGTLRAYYHFKDRGDTQKLRTLVARGSLAMLPKGNVQGMSSRAQELRGIAVDHAEEKPGQAILHYRTWFSRATEMHGGRPCVARLVKEAGSWKFDMAASLQKTAGITKGRDKLGFYDGTKEWWK